MNLDTLTTIVGNMYKVTVTSLAMFPGFCVGAIFIPAERNISPFLTTLC